jgi:hypothetical protein
MGHTLRIPCADMTAVRAGDQAALIVALCALTNKLLSVAGYGLNFPISAAEIAVTGDTSRTGLLAAGIELRELLVQYPQGRKALGGFGYVIGE